MPPPRWRARFCSETEVVVVGGGNSAGQAAMYLSRVAKQVHLLVRGAGLAETMSAYLAIALRPIRASHTHREPA
jgi:thioredoxin reductase (NADPH)